MRRNIILNFL